MNGHTLHHQQEETQRIEGANVRHGKINVELIAVKLVEALRIIAGQDVRSSIEVGRLVSDALMELEKPPVAHAGKNEGHTCDPGTNAADFRAAAAAPYAPSPAPVKHLCLSCQHELPTCVSGFITWGIDKNPQATGAEADTVLDCEGYTPEQPAPVHKTAEGEPCPKCGTPFLVTPICCHCGSIPILGDGKRPVPVVHTSCYECADNLAETDNCNGCVQSAGERSHWTPAQTPKGEDAPRHKDNTGQAKAWETVFKTCMELGMVLGNTINGEKDVCAFIRDLHRRAQPVTIPMGKVPLDIPNVVPAMIDQLNQMVDQLLKMSVLAADDFELMSNDAIDVMESLGMLKKRIGENIDAFDGV